MWRNALHLSAMILGLSSVAGPVLAENSPELFPTALVLDAERRQLLVACAAAKRILFLDWVSRKTLRDVSLPGSPSGIAVSGGRVFVTCAAPESRVLILSATDGRWLGEIPAGHTAMAPVITPDGNTLFVCNRFNNDVSVIDVNSGREVRRIPVLREPVAAVLVPNGGVLLVANHLHAGRANGHDTAACVTVIDALRHAAIKHIRLPNGSGLLRGICVSPDGRHACVTHIFARYQLPTFLVDMGWINSNAISLLDLERLEWINTVLLDERESGAANPWGTVWTPDRRWICVAHAGTHELSVIDAPALLAKLDQLPPAPVSADRERQARWTPYRRPHFRPAAHAGEVSNALAFLNGLRRRVRLNGVGPRAITSAGAAVVAANYFSDDLSVLDLRETTSHQISLPGGSGIPSLARQGERWFNDATLCFQGWQSCASCHDEDARVDALNWDLLNDGYGNGKNVKSLLLAHQTPPAMSLGVRDNAETAVRAGLRKILFSPAPVEVAEAIDAYARSLRSVPSPCLVAGRLSPAAERGRLLFHDSRVGCSQCHIPPLFTDLRAYDVGTQNENDQSTDAFDTPTLVELWRTAPYLHDGSAGTLKEVLTGKNKDDLHGQTSHLTPVQLEELIEYLLSL